MILFLFFYNKWLGSVNTFLLLLPIWLGSYVMVVHATDLDASNSKNGTFDFRIVSVTPEPSDLEFYLDQIGDYGNISFRGCLDYEVRDLSYVILSVLFSEEKNI